MTTLQYVHSVVSRTPSILTAILQEQPEDVVRSTEGPGTWSAFDVVGHLIHGEKTDWIPRVKIILQHGDTQPFVPFQREAMFADSKGKSLDDLLREFAELRKENVRALMDLNLADSDLSRKGMHPALGSVTLGQLLAAWAVHDLDHLAQVLRTIAKFQEAETGPWKAYLSILTDRNPA